MKTNKHLLKTLLFAATLLCGTQIFAAGGGNQKTSSGNGYTYNFGSRSKFVKNG